MKIHTLTRIEIDLDDNAVADVFHKHLAKLCGPEDVYLNDNGLLETWEDTGHGSGVTHTHGKPTDVQKAAIKLQRLLRNLRHG